MRLLPALFKGLLSPFVCARHVAFAFVKVALPSTNYNFGGSVWPLAIFLLKKIPPARHQVPCCTAPINRALKSARPSLPAGRTPAPSSYLAAPAPCRSRGASLSCSTAFPKGTKSLGAWFRKAATEQTPRSCTSWRATVKCAALRARVGPAQRWYGA